MQGSRFCVLGLFPAVLFAQGGRSTILGTVVDESGGAVPRAVITVLNTGTQLKRSTLTSERGDFEVPVLDLGDYEDTAEAAGFRKAVVQDIHLQVDQRARVDIRLQLGEVTQQTVSFRTTGRSCPTSPSISGCATSTTPPSWILAGSRAT